MTVNDDDRDRPAQPELDALLDVLRQPARPDELAGEQEAVAAMAAALASSHQEGLAPVPIKHTRKFAAVGVAAALILGGVTAAAASVLSGSSNDNRVEIPSQPASSTTSTSLETTTSSSSVPDTTSTSSSVPETNTTAVTDPGTTATTDDDTTDPTVEDDTSTTIDCPDGVRNHGDFVSDVARDTAAGPGHGEAVSAAARSDCGQDSASTSVPEPGTTATTDDHGGDNSGPGRGDDDATTTVVTEPGTTATTDDHGGGDNSGPGGGEDNSGRGSGSDTSGRGGSDDGSGHD